MEGRPQGDGRGSRGGIACATRRTVGLDRIVAELCHRIALTNRANGDMIALQSAREAAPIAYHSPPLQFAGHRAMRAAQPGHARLHRSRRNSATIAVHTAPVKPIMGRLNSMIGFEGRDDLRSIVSAAS